jgi:hypothetical protein
VRALFALVAAAGLAGGLWWLTRSPEEPLPPDEAGAAARDGEAEVGATGPETAERPEPTWDQIFDPSQHPPKEDPLWRDRVLVLRPGRGPVRGRDLLEALEDAKILRPKEQDPADRKALEETFLDVLDRDREMRYVEIENALMVAGFEAHVRFPWILYRRLDPTGGRPQ